MEKVISFIIRNNYNTYAPSIGMNLASIYNSNGTGKSI